MKNILFILFILLTIGIVPSGAQDTMDPLGDSVIQDNRGTVHTFHQSYDWLGDPTTHNVYYNSFLYPEHSYRMYHPYGWYNVYSVSPSYYYWYPTYGYYYSEYPGTYSNSYWYSGIYSGIYLR